MSKPLVQVAAAVFEDHAGQVLIAERPADKPLAGFWEFPGGKIERGESALQALRRECHEELGVTVGEARPLIRYVTEYPERFIGLDVYRVNDWSGEMQSMEGQRFAWDVPGKLGAYDLLPANRPIVSALCLPDTYVITPPDSLSRSSEVLSRTRLAIENGCGLFQLRCHDADLAQLKRFGRSFADLVHGCGAEFLVNSDTQLAMDLDADGLHLNARMLAAAAHSGRSREDWKCRWLAASCHDSIELDLAVQLGVDFAVLGPLAETGSHPGASPLGWQRFQSMIARVAMPVFAIGGLDVSDCVQAATRGAQGVAGIGAWFSAE